MQGHSVSLHMLNLEYLDKLVLKMGVLTNVKAVMVASTEEVHMHA